MDLKRYLMERYANGNKGFTWKNIRDNILSGYEPGRIDVPTHERRKLNEQLEQYRNEGLLILRKEKSEEAFTLYNGSFTKKMEDLCSLHGYVTVDSMERTIFSSLLRFQPESGEMQKFRESQLQAQKHDLSLWGKTADPSLLYDSLRAADAVFLNRNLTYLRDFSIRVFSNSKRMENKELLLRSKAFIRKSASCTQLDEFDTQKKILGDNYSILSLFGIIKNPYLIPIEGHFRIVTKNGIVETHGYPYAFHTRCLSEYEHIFIEDENFMTIENKTTYEDAYLMKGTARMYVGGFPGFAEKEILRKIAKDNQGLKFLHWSDIDYGGFKIFHNIRNVTKRSEPYRMDIATLQKYSAYTKNLTQTDRTRLESIIGDRTFSPVIQYMLADDIKLEQESFYADNII